MAQTYRNGKRIHVFISEELNEMITEHLAEGESRSAFIQKCVAAYLERENPHAPVSRMDHEHVIKYYFEKYFGKTAKKS